jgi:hypothetical protein
MKKLRALTMLLLSLQMPFITYAMDDPDPSIFTVGDAKYLLNAKFYDEVPSFDGCCCSHNGCCCSNNDCSALNCALNISCGIIGAISLILGGGLVGGGHPDHGRDYYQYNLIYAGYAMFANFFLMLVTPTAVLYGINKTSNCVGNAHNKKINKLLKKLNENYWNDQARLCEDQICAMADYIFEDKIALKKLDPGQALALALIDFDKFKALVEISQTADSIFSPTSTDYTIMFLQMLDIQDPAQLSLDETKAHFVAQPALYRVLEYYLAPHMLPELQLAHVFSGIFNRADGSSYKICPSEKTPLIISSDVILELEEHDNRIDFAFDDLLLTTTKERLCSLSKVFKKMFKDLKNLDEKEIQIKVNDIKAYSPGGISIDDDLYRYLINFANQDQEERESLIINNENLIPLLNLQEAFDIALIKNKCDLFCLKHEVPGKNNFEQTQFVCKYHLPKNCAIFKQGLLERMKKLNFESEELQCFLLFEAHDRQNIIDAIDWQSLYQRFFHKTSHLKEVWDRCAVLQVGDIKAKIVDFNKYPDSKSKIRWAFGQKIPPEFLSN